MITSSATQRYIREVVWARVVQEAESRHARSHPGPSQSPSVLEELLELQQALTRPGWPSFR